MFMQCVQTSWGVHAEIRILRWAAYGTVRLIARELFMHNLAKYEEEEIMYAKRYLQDHYTNMVREGEEINPYKGQEEETGF